MLLCAAVVEGVLDGTAENLSVLLQSMQEAKDEGADLLLFGESFLTGFEAMSFNYEEDIQKALALNSVELATIRKTARDLKLAVGFGFHEAFRGAIYASYVLVDKKGQLLGPYRRRSKGWKEAVANADYREGKAFQVFELEGRRLGLFICGDFWEDALLPDIVNMDPDVELFLWPVHTDYELSFWDDEECEAYRKRSQILEKPVFFINNYVTDEGRAKGGAYLWRQGKTLAAQKMGEKGLFYVSFPELV